jgi:muconolactone D-isomerase
MEFLVHRILYRTPEVALREREAIRARELARAGILLRLWRVPGRCENWGIWSAKDARSLHKVLASLPMFSYLGITVHPLALYPNDPQMVHGLGAGPHSGDK